ncbi:hypothetical protein ID866_6824 [Astraeus odoratus]|nr:hypothetical protein ID866_6824 [Astraeus odoratus]
MVHTLTSEESTALQGGCLSSFLDQLWSIAIFRSWRILFFFAIWSTAVCLINHFAYPLALKSTLLTVLGIVLGFVISFRTTTSYDRHNEARKLWSRMVFATRMFARTVWFHVPEDAPGGVDSKDQSLDKRNARILLEKKAVINLLEAYPIAVKHYLRREGNIDYVDLYWFVHFLPRYPFPSNIYDNDREHRRGPRDGGEAEMGLGEQGLRRTPSRMHQRGSTTTSNTLTEASSHNRHPSASDRSLSRSGNHLRPAENPYKKSFIERCIPYPRTRRKDQVDNVPLEISFYLARKLSPVYRQAY